VGLAPPFPVGVLRLTLPGALSILSEAGFLPELALASCAAAGDDVFSAVPAFAEMGLAISLVMSLFVRPLKVPPRDLWLAAPADPRVPKKLLERPTIFALVCLSAGGKPDLAVSAALGGTGELVGPVKLLIVLVVGLGGLVCRAFSTLAVGVVCVLGGDGVFLLKKLLSGEVLLVLIWLLEVGVEDVAPNPTPVGVVF